MSNQIFPVTDRAQYRKAGETDLIELLPAPGGNPLYLPRGILDSFVAGIVSHRFIHLSGPTGTAKTALINALRRVPDLSRTPRPGRLLAGARFLAGALVAVVVAAAPGSGGLALVLLAFATLLDRIEFYREAEAVSPQAEAWRVGHVPAAPSSPDPLPPAAAR